MKFVLAVIFSLLTGALCSAQDAPKRNGFRTRDYLGRNVSGGLSGYGT